jgi:membrane protein YdbS with pleckstrin-like domain
MGKILLNNGILLGRLFYYLALGILVLGLLLSPSSKRAYEYVYFEGVFRRRLVSTILIGISMFLAVMTYPTHFKYNVNLFQGKSYAIERSTKTGLTQQLSQAEINQDLRNSFVVILNQPKPKSKSYKFRIFLLVLLEIILVLIAAILACAIVCFSVSILSVLAGLGFAVVVYVIVIVYRALNRTKARQNQAMSKS